MKPKTSSEPAFPHVNETKFDGVGAPYHAAKFTGLTKREYFAAKAMQGILKNPYSVGLGVGEKFEAYSEAAFRLADAMLAESEREN